MAKRGQKRGCSHITMSACHDNICRSREEDQGYFGRSQNSRSTPACGRAMDSRPHEPYPLLPAMPLFLSGKTDECKSEAPTVRRLTAFPAEGTPLRSVPTPWILEVFLHKPIRHACSVRRVQAERHFPCVPGTSLRGIACGISLICTPESRWKGPDGVDGTTMKHVRQESKE